MAVGILTAFALVAQPDRVFGYEPKGRGCESLPARQVNSTSFGVCYLFFCREMIRGTRTLRGHGALSKTVR